MNESGQEEQESSPLEKSREKVRSQENPEMISLLDRDGYGSLELSDVKQRTGGVEDKYYGETRVDSEAGLKYDKRVRYNKDGGGQELDTLYASSESVKHTEVIKGKDDKPDITVTKKEVGQNLDMDRQGHAWETKWTHDDNGNIIKETGETTGGEKQGESYSKTFETDQHGPYQRKSEINTVKKFQGKGDKRELVQITNIKREHFDASGNKVLGYQQDVGKPDSLMMWDGDGNKVETPPEDISIEIEKIR